MTRLSERTAFYVREGENERERKKKTKQLFLHAALNSRDAFIVYTDADTLF
jgi:hypothetical protein